MARSVIKDSTLMENFQAMVGVHEDQVRQKMAKYPECAVLTEYFIGLLSTTDIHAKITCS
jgi:hypothetical protein